MQLWLFKEGAGARRLRIRVGIAPDSKAPAAIINGCLLFALIIEALCGINDFLREHTKRVRKVFRSLKR